MNHASDMHAGNGSTDQSSMNMHKPMHTARNGRTDSSQDAAVDQLNDQSYQAAQQGRAFTVGAGGDNGSAAATNSSGSSSMNSASPSNISGMGAGGGAGGTTKSDGAK